MNGSHLTLAITATGLELDANINGLQLKVGGSMEAILPLLLVCWKEIQKHLPEKK